MLTDFPQPLPLWNPWAFPHQPGSWEGVGKGPAQLTHTPMESLTSPRRKEVDVVQFFIKLNLLNLDHILRNSSL